jgi:hypothetical protein
MATAGDNAGLDQYLEQAPTPGGGTPTRGDKPGERASHQGSSLPARVVASLESLGPSGHEAAAVLSSTGLPTHGARPSFRSGSPDTARGNTASALQDALLGKGGPLGAGLPLIGAAILGASIASVVRRRIRSRR